MKTLYEMITNWTDLVSELADRMMQADIDCNRYQTDVYMYLHKDGSAEISDFVNVGGNSWLDDAHITVWIDHEHNEDYLDWYTSVTEIADMLDLTVSQVKEIVYNDMFPQGDDDITISDIDYADIVHYIKSGKTMTADEWSDCLFDAYAENIRELYPEYLERAEWALVQKCDEVRYNEMLREEMELCS